jgi:hypothetical protein
MVLKGLDAPTTARTSRETQRKRIYNEIGIWEYPLWSRVAQLVEQVAVFWGK